MFDFFTYAVYLILLFTLIISTKSFARRRKPISDEITFLEETKIDFKYLSVLIFISFIVGYRYFVGVDWEGYVNDFNDFKLSLYKGFSSQYYEYGYYILTYFISEFNFGYEVLFSIVAYISWFFIFKSVHARILPMFIFFLFADEYFFWSMNGVRQFAAISFWLISIRYIIKRNLVKFILYVFLGSLFHKSLLVLIPIYYLPFNKLYNKKWWIIIYLFTVLLANVEVFSNFLRKFILFLGDSISIVNRYVRYIDSGRLESQNTALGLGFYFKIGINLLIILFSDKVIEMLPKLKIYFVLFFIGAVTFNVFYDFQLIGRFNHFFLINRALVLALIYYFLIRNLRYKLILNGVVVLYFVLFLYSIYKSSNMCNPYNLTFFQ
ncbi:conserved membrane hypothetical protein [Tenacibaculum sp. 190524A05c]|uniref:EpsG family protein n=1 Tax=Tenacibaculum platacis TaxID=3137852 RepID=UPI0031FB160D